MINITTILCYKLRTINIYVTVNLRNHTKIKILKSQTLDDTIFVTSKSKYNKNIFNSTFLNEYGIDILKVNHVILSNYLLRLQFSTLFSHS